MSAFPALTWPRLQPTFERELHARVIGGKIGVYPVADSLGVHGKTVEAWLYSGSEPGGAALLRCFELFGPDFETAVRGNAGQSALRTVSRMDLVSLRRRLAGEIERLDGLIGAGGNVVDLKDRGAA